MNCWRLMQRPLDFFPSRDATDIERLESIVRFVAYSAVAVSLYRQDAGPLLAGVAIIGTVFALYPLEGFGGGRSRAKNVPTPDNPFMNVLVNEYSTPKAPPSGGSGDSRMTHAYFERGLPREISDVYHKRASDRQFVTMPVTDNIPDTLAFRNFLYGPAKKP